MDTRSEDDRVYSPEQITAILKAAQEEDDPLLYTALLVFAFTGIRPEELRGLESVILILSPKLCISGRLQPLVRRSDPITLLRGMLGRAYRSLVRPKANREFALSIWMNKLFWNSKMARIHKGNRSGSV